MKGKVTKSPQEILNDIDRVASQLVEEFEVEQISIKLICQRAGIAVGTFYKFYPTKDDLLWNKALLLDTKLENDVMPYISGTSEEKLFQLFKGVAKVIQNVGCNYASHMYGFIFKNQVDTQDYIGRAIYTYFYDIIKECQDTGVFSAELDTKELALLSISFIRGSCAEWARRKGDFDLQKQLDLSCKLWINGIKSL